MRIHIHISSHRGARPQQADSFSYRLPDGSILSATGDFSQTLSFDLAVGETATVAVSDGMSCAKYAKGSSSVICRAVTAPEGTEVESAILSVQNKFNKASDTDLYGTTLVCAVLEVNADGKSFSATLYNVGDSPCFISDDATLWQEATLDNRAYQKLAEQGQEALYEGGLAGSNILTNFLGIQNRQMVIHKKELRDLTNEKLLLGSDGLFQLSRDNIFQTLYNLSVEDRTNVAETLVKQAAMAVNSDNVTAALIFAEQ